MRNSRTQPSPLALLAADFGNFELKYTTDEGTTHAIRSVHYRLPKGINGLLAKPTSPIVELPDSSRYHFGSQAFKYQSQEKTVVQDKALLARLHLYACLESSGELRLLVSHHSPDQYRTLLQKALMGNHEFKRNGATITATVTDVQVIAEGQGAYWQAKSMGFIPPSGYTILVDIGGGSWLSTVYDAEGDAIAHHVVDRMGTYHLALQIANDERLKAPLRAIGITAPDPALVMDGFRNGHRYAETGLSWMDWLEEYLDPWYRNIFSTIKAQYTAHMPYTRRFIVTGGGSHLIAERVKKSAAFIVMPDPNFASVLGMHSHFAAAPALLATA